MVVPAGNEVFEIPSECHAVLTVIFQCQTSKTSFGVGCPGVELVAPLTTKKGERGKEIT